MSHTVTVTVQNSTSQVLTLHINELPEGNWSTGQQPPQSIPAGSAGDYSSVTFAAASIGDGNVEGTVAYTTAGGTIATLTFSNPYGSENSWSGALGGSDTDAYQWTNQGGSAHGDALTLIYTFAQAD